MSEKRFTSEVTDTGIYYYDNGVRIFEEDFLSIMNNLHEETLKLRKENEKLRIENQGQVKLI